MIIERDKHYKLYLAVYVFVFISLLLIYMYGFDVPIGFALLINSPVCILSILDTISYGRTFIMDAEGCTVCFWKYRKKYAWEELETKKIEAHNLPSMFNGRLSCPYLKEAIASPYKIRKPKLIRARLYSLFHPFSCIYINFSLENEAFQIGRYYEIEERIFRQNMKDWGVDWAE